MRKIQGFTLIEVIVVIIVISILAVLPFVNMPDASLNLDGQAQQLASDIRYTQALSMAKGQRYRLVISGSSYQILNTAGAVTRLASGNTSVTLNSGISFGTISNLPNNLIAFDGEGIPYTTTGTPGTALTASASIELLSGGRNASVIIAPVTGQVTTP